jgi:pimeloyl-ACP methyl ester carboxylesterase
MATYVLVHGAWSGAHGFRLVRAALQDSGHRVFTPSLTGVGERAHLTSPGVGLSTHVSDVVNHVLHEDLHGIVLLGFSYGGCVVTGALEHIAARVRHLVYLDAFVPEDGQSVLSLGGRAVEPMGLGDPWLVPPADREFDDPAEGAFMRARRTPQPIGCFREPVRLERALEDYPFTRTYIRATADRRDAPFAAVFDAAAERARRSADWRYREVATNHMVASNRPDELAALLQELA